MATNNQTGTNLDAVRKALLKPPVKQELNQWETILSLHEEIEAARATGKTVEQMHADLKACGLNIKYGTFRKYVSDLVSLRSQPNAVNQHLAPSSAQYHTLTNRSVTDEADTQGLRSVNSRRGLGM
jgi:hypothetical protein